MTLSAPDPAGVETAAAGMARLEAQHATDQGTIGDLEAAKVVDRAVIMQLEADGMIDRDKIANLETALATCRRIGGAIGVIMTIQKVTQEQAFEVLRDASQKTNRKLRDVADAVLTTGDVQTSPPNNGRGGP